MINSILKGFSSELEKLATNEYAPGLPERGKTHPIREVKKPENWEFVMQQHGATRDHVDLRIGDPKTGHGHSWVLPKQLPKPGEYIDIPRVETHDLDYFDFKGEIPKGTYGAGKVKPIDRGQVEVYKSEPGRLSFLKHDGNITQRFTLVGEEDGNKWRLINHTPTRKKFNLPTKKVPVKLTDKEMYGEQYGHSPKLSGAHSIIDLPRAGSLVNVFSYRQSKRRPDLPIDHTFKMPDYYKNRVASGMGGTRIRGELIAVDKSGKPLDEQVIGGILNSTVPNSRDTQKELGATLKAFIYNIEKYRGRDVGGEHPDVKDELIQKVVKTLPKDKFIALTQERAEKAQRELFENIKSGKHPLTSEGVVIREHKAGGKLFKRKLRPDFDVYVRKIFQEVDKSGKPKEQAGGFLYSNTPKGPIVGKVGTGFSRDLKQDMWHNKNKYVGRVAKVTSARQTGKGVLFQPAFTNWHIEK